MGVGGMSGVAVYSPIKIGMGANVEVGTFGSHVGIRTMVGETVMVGVMDGVHVGSGVYVTNSVFVGMGVAVDGTSNDERSFIEHDCNRIANAKTKCNLRISDLNKTIIL